MMEGFEPINPGCHGCIIPFPSLELVQRIVDNPDDPEMVQVGNLLAEKFPKELGFLKK